MATITLRSVKGSALTFAEGDDNFNNLNTDKIENVVEDTTPQLGGDLDAQSNNITNLVTLNTHTVPGGTGTIALTSDITFTDVVQDTTPQLGGDLDCQGNTISNPVLEDYAETIHSLGSTDTPTTTISNGNVQSVTITSG